MAEWMRVCAVEEIPVLGARVIRAGQEDISIFRNQADELFALHDKCPHRGGPLSQGIVHGRSVTCPLHSWVIDLATGQPTGADAGKGCTPVVPVLVKDGRILLAQPAMAD